MAVTRETVAFRAIAELIIFVAVLMLHVLPTMFATVIILIAEELAIQTQKHRDLGVLVTGAVMQIIALLLTLVHPVIAELRELLAVKVQIAQMMRLIVLVGIVLLIPAR